MGIQEPLDEQRSRMLEAIYTTNKLALNKLLTQAISVRDKINPYHSRTPRHDAFIRCFQLGERVQSCMAGIKLVAHPATPKEITSNQFVALDLAGVGINPIVVFTYYGPEES